MTTPVAEEIVEEVLAEDLWVAETRSEIESLLPKGNVHIEESSVIEEDDEQENDSKGDLKAEFYRVSFFKRPNPWLLAISFFVLLCGTGLVKTPQIDRIIELVCSEDMDISLIPSSEKDLQCRAPKIMAKVAKVSLYRDVIRGVCSFAVLPRLVSLSDRVGRRPLIIYCGAFSLINHILEALCFISKPILNYRILYLTSFVDGIGAGPGGAMLMAFPYISDCVKDKKRSRYFTVVTGIQFGAMAIAPNLGSQIFKKQGNMDLLSCMSITGDVLATFLFITVLVESRSAAERRMSISTHSESFSSQMTSWSSLIDNINIFKPLKTLRFDHLQDQSARRLAMFLVIVKFFLVLMTMFTIAPIELLMEMMFQWRASELGIVMTLVGGVAALSLSVLVPLLLHVFGQIYKASSNGIDKIDTRIIQIGCLSLFFGILLMACSPTATMFLVGLCVAQVWTIIPPVVQSVLVKYADKKHIGMVFGAMNQVGQASILIGQSLGLAVFQYFIEVNVRSNMYISSALTGFFILIIFFILR